MRKRILTIVLAVLVVAIAVPLGAALTLDRRAPAHHTDTALSAAVIAPAPGSLTPFAETGALALAGGVLIALAAAVRRAQ